MKIFLRLYLRLRWLHVPGALLIALLQRTPVLRVATLAEEYVVASPMGAVLRSAFTAAASLGALHTLAGATQFVANINPVNGTVGTAISTVTITVTGAQTPPGSFRITSGTVPAGLTIANLNTSTNIINSTNVIISGTPTTAGTSSILLRAYEFSNAQGDSFPATAGYQVTFNISSGAAVAPAITVQPQSQTVNAGSNVTFTTTASGSPTPTFQWSKDGSPINGATASSLTLTTVQAASAGSYTVTATNSAGATTSNPATLTVTATSAPTITTQPASVSVASGSTAVFSVVASGTPAPTYQWRKDNATLTGATNATLIVNSATSTNAGSYTCVVSNSVGTATSGAATLGVATTTDVGRLINLSVRTNDGTDAQVLIVGFAVGGAGTSGAKPLLVRGIGPSLAQFGLNGVLADPVAKIFQNSTMVTSNNNWAGDATVAARAAQVGAFPLATDSLDAAIPFSPSPGTYSVQVPGNNNGTGIVLAEIYDATPSSSFTATTPRLVNVSARTQVGTGADILIAGFVVGGSTAKTLLIRATGPALAAFGVNGVIADPKLQLFSSSTLLRENNDWGGDPQLTAAGNSVGAFGVADTGSKDAMLLVTLAPGNYTAQVSGADGGTGVGLVEVYEVP